MSEYMTSLKAAAKPLGDYTKYSINDLADGFCKALDENDSMNQNIYVSALMLRFWYTVSRMYEKCKTAGIEYEEVPDILYDCIVNACEYRAWQKSELNAQQCINQSIATRGTAAIMYRSNLKKNKGKALDVSLEDPIDDAGEQTIGETIEDENSTNLFDMTYSAVQQCLNNNKVVEAIIAEVIAHSNEDLFRVKHIRTLFTTSEGEIEEVSNDVLTFWEHKLVQVLGKLDDNFTKSFLKTYTISDSKYTAAYNTIRKATNSKKYKMFEATKKYLMQVYN